MSVNVCVINMWERWGCVVVVVMVGGFGLMRGITARREERGREHRAGWRERKPEELEQEEDRLREATADTHSKPHKKNAQFRRHMEDEEQREF